MCHAFVQPGEEDFGISLVEALACGAPVAALGRGGALDTVVDGVNGALAAEPTGESLAEAVARLEAGRFGYTEIRATALKFSRERFVGEFRREVEDVIAGGERKRPAEEAS